MWVIDNNTPFAVDRAFLRGVDGGEVWIVVVRGTFMVRADGSLRRADEQPPPLRAAVHRGVPAKSSLVADTDFWLDKPRVDLIVNATAYAPTGKPAPEVDVALRFAGRTKALRVHGIRAWMKGAAGGVVPGPARPFVSQAVSYEEAYGGVAPGPVPEPHDGNPVGRGYARDRSTLLAAAAHRIEMLGARALAPAGFGALAPGWMPRRALAGTFDESWRRSRAPLPPADHNARFACAAPEDQQLDPASPLDLVELLNLTPDGYMAVRLPRLAFRVRTVFAGGAVDRPARAHTIRIDPDQRQVTLTWHMALPCPGREQELSHAIVSWEGDATCLSP